jgi:hypothetical protein
MTFNRSQAGHMNMPWTEVDVQRMALVLLKTSVRSEQRMFLHLKRL